MIKSKEAFKGADVEKLRSYVFTSLVEAKRYVHDELGLESSYFMSPVIVDFFDDKVIKYRLKGTDDKLYARKMKYKVK